MRIEHLLAFACVPNLFPAVEIDGMAYWDGLFSDNPPIQPLIKRDYVGINNIPQEIWVIKINPTTSDKIPVMANDISDRRNQLEGNISLFQSLRAIEDMNTALLRGAFRTEFMAEVDVKEAIKIPKLFSENPDQPYHIPMIEMSAILILT